MDWYLDVTDLQGIKVAGHTADQMAWSIVTEFRLITGITPQPPSPIYQQLDNQSDTQLAAQNSISMQHAKRMMPTSRLNVQVGGKVQFGQYPQGLNGEVMPLYWRVLTIENGRALLITEKLIDTIPYNSEFDYITWENCTLRKWMNNDFINRAFSVNLQTQILTITNQNSYTDPDSGVVYSSVTRDKIFALSVNEASQYFCDDDDRMAAVTEYTSQQGVGICDDLTARTNHWKNSLPNGDKTGAWWLRSTVINGSTAALVLHRGCIYQPGNYIILNTVAVRPAFWLKLS